MRIGRSDVVPGVTSNFGVSGVSGVSAGASSLTPFLLEDYAGIATWHGKPIYNQQQVIGQLDSGARLDVSDNTITFAFADFQHYPGINNNPHLGEGAGYSPMSPEERDVARQGIQLWDDLIPQHFQEVQPGPGASTWAHNNVDIWLSMRRQPINSSAGTSAQSLLSLHPGSSCTSQAFWSRTNNKSDT